MPQYGQLTARGGAEVETFLTDLLDQASSRFADVLPEDTYRSVILIGGYGRGEGGVQTIDGQEKPHNNLDLLVITKPAFSDDRKPELAAIAEQLSEQAGLGIDIGYIEEARLVRSECLVMWYDMRFGHKTLLGDADFLSGLDQFTADRVQAADVLKLMVNRGTLLIINDVLLESFETSSALPESSRKLILKHVMKAIIGFGDAYLYSRGRYDWSYLEKQRRMQSMDDAPADLKRIYEEALEFRFSPNYDSYADRDLHAMAEELRDSLEPVFLRFEAHRLVADGLLWDDYLHRALRREITSSLSSPREIAKRAVYTIKEPGIPKAGGLLPRIASRAAGSRQLMPLLFPAVYFDRDHASQPLADAARGFLNAESDSPADLRRAYLRKWGDLGDINFRTVVEKHGIDLNSSIPLS